MVNKSWSQPADSSKGPTFVQIQNLPISAQPVTSGTNQSIQATLTGTGRQALSYASNVTSVTPNANPVTVSSTSTQQTNPTFASG